jgi:zinc transporter
MRARRRHPVGSTIGGDVFPKFADIDRLQQSIKLLEEDIAGRIAGHTDRSVLILTADTVIALRINLLAGLLGMNVGSLPFRYDAHGFWIVAAIPMLLTSLAAWLIFHPRRD